MSSSRPSRRSSSSSASTTVNRTSNPKWRSPYSKDARAKTTLSLVFAEPEEPKSISPGTAEKHIASMQDAINKLPGDTVSEQVIPETRKGSWFSSISKKRRRKGTTQPVPENLMTEEPPNTIPEVELTLPPQNTSNGSPTANDPQPAPPPARNNPVEPPIEVPLDNPPPSLLATSQPLTGPQNVQGVLSKPTHLDVLSPTVSIASVDDFVPRPKISPDVSIPAPPQNPVPITIGDVTTMGMAPATTSRFTLRLPLLGRPKIPLNQAMAVAQAEDIRNSVPPEPVNDDSAASSAATTEDVRRPIIPAIPSDTNVLSEQVDQSQSVGITTLEDTSKTVEELATEQDTRETQENSQVQCDTASPPPSSWWNYIGLSGTQPTETAQLPSISVDVAPPMEQTESARSEPPSAVTTESPVLLSIPQSPLNPLPPTPDPDADDTTKPASIVSSEGQSSSWLTPWNWYSSSTATPPPSRSPLPPVEEEGERGLTESQMIREAALARDSQPPSVTVQPPAPASESVEVIDTVKDDKAYPDEVNPIRSTIGTNRSGWTSFFMARNVKSVTEDGEKKSIGNEPGTGEMEVMEVPDPEDLPPDVTTTAATTTAATPANCTPTPGGTGTVAAIMNQLMSKPSAPSIKSSSSKVPVSPVQPLKEIEKEQELGDKEPKKTDSPAPPLTNSEDIKKETAKKTSERPSSPSPSKRSGTSRPISPRNGPPNLVLPTWGDIFHAPPRSLLPISMMRREDGKAEYAVTKTIKSLWSMGLEVAGMGSVKGKERAENRGARGEISPSELADSGKELPRALGVTGDQMDPSLLQGACRVVVIGIAGWSPGAVTRTIAGGLPSSSVKFVNMTCDALASFEEEHDIKFAKVTKIPLEGDGTISRKVEKVYQHLLSSEEWVDDIHAADIIFVSAHSQGCIVSTHLVDLLIRDRHVITSSTGNVGKQADNSANDALDGVRTSNPNPKGRQRICCLSLCGIHLGPLRYLKLSSFIQPYIQYFENAAAQEIFQFQNTENAVSREYVKALSNVMHHGTKMVYVASLNDQMVPIYSGIFAAANHPRILRALYIDGDAYHSSDFLSNLLVLLLRIMNAGLSDGGLLTHLSEATAGSLSGVGHSSVYEDPGVFELAVKYQFLANDGEDTNHDLQVDSFNAVQELNDYEIPWSLRDLIANERVAHFFSREFVTLRDAFCDWQPKTSILRDVKRKLQPIQRLSLVERTASPPPPTEPSRL